MYPAITLTILILMLLHSSVNRNHKLRKCKSSNALDSENELDLNCTNPQLNRPELRELSLYQLAELIQIFNNTNFNEKLQLKFGQDRSQALTPLLDELLETKSSGLTTMPYWDYRLDYNLPVPLDSILFQVEPFKAMSAIQRNEIATDETVGKLFETATETVYDLYDKALWMRRKNAYDMLEQLHAGILWKVLFYMTIENDMDMDEDIPLTTVFKDIKRYEETGTNEDRSRRGRRRTSRAPANRRRARGMINRNPTTKRNSKAKKSKKSLYLLNHISLNGSYIYEKDKWLQMNCNQNPWLFWNSNKSSCIARIALGRRCVGFEQIPTSCYNSICILRKCRISPRVAAISSTSTTSTTTTIPTTNPITTMSENENFEKDQFFEVLKQAPIEVEFELPINFTIEPINEEKNDSKTFMADIVEDENSILPTEERHQQTTTKLIETMSSTPPDRDIYTTKQNPPQPDDNQSTTQSQHNPEFATETTSSNPWIWNTDGNNVFSTTARNDFTSTLINYHGRKNKERRKNRKNRNKKYEQKILEEEIRKLKDPEKENSKRKHRRKKHKSTTTSTTPLLISTLTTTMKPIVFPATHPQRPQTPTTKLPVFIEDIVPFTEANWLPMPPANEETNLDNLLPLLPTPSMPEGTIRWNDKTTPFDMAYFTITIAEGPMHRKEPPKKRAIGARIYLMGLNMPSGYTQITEGWQMKRGTGALVRTLNPEIAGPFVEFKIRVENRYGSPCKQMCLDSKQRYRRCARRVLRLSAYQKFSDPILYFKNSTMAMNAQWTGRGYYRKRKLDYILFKCE